MKDATLAVHKAAYQALYADTDLQAELGGARIFDRVPERARPPYVVLGDARSDDWSTATEGGEAIVFFVHIWTRSGHRRDNHALQAHAKRILTADGLTIEDHHLVAQRYQFSDTRRDRLHGYLHGVLRFRAVTEPVTNI
ncbi:DUF3168 domain-containing protein [Ahrensia sp. R2A130]|uniref:DUF3168 domain-containing protein n=1 Tax=Ahrensia sp. R2A130 TaxID=744979 RepID=UPI0001E0E8C1|nr:DUF3168 domain-containing protein [Ahrensia sp. R2A130]EFL88959.1 gene transfer agent protein [Ahrensia sp. R2A130]